MQITIPDIDEQLKPYVAKMLARVVFDVNAEQLSQVGDAFKNSGQPSKKWAPLWADTFVGKIPWKRQGALINAQSAFHKATTAKNPDAGKIARAMLRVQKARAKALNATSYRKGGKPLLDNGTLAASFHKQSATVNEAAMTAEAVIHSTSGVAPFHQEGFFTRGPNFIPLSLKARREHKPKTDPKSEGLEEGVDYIMAWAGVHIPDRPMIDYDDPVNLKHIEDAIGRAMKRKG